VLLEVSAVASLLQCAKAQALEAVLNYIFDCVFKSYSVQEWMEKSFEIVA
jgi:hypothetical protein